MLITADLSTAARIESFLITGGHANASGNSSLYSGKTFFNDSGAGMYNHNSSPNIVNTVFSGNIADFGGGMYNDRFSPSIVNTVFRRNSASNGGGMYNDNSSQTLSIRCLAEIQLLKTVAECMIYLHPQA